MLDYLISSLTPIIVNLKHLKPFFDLGWGTYPLAFFAIAFLATALPSIVLSPPKTSLDNRQWYELARQLYPITVFHSMAGIFFLIFATMLSSSVTVVKDAPWLFVMCCSSAAYAGVVLSSYLFVSSKFRQFLSPKHFSLNTFLREHLAALSTFGAIIMIMNLSMKIFESFPYAVLLGCVAGFIVIALASFGGLNFFISALYGLVSPSSERTRSVLTEAAALAGLKAVPRSIIIKSNATNAWAISAYSAVGFTEQLVNRLTDEELLAVSLHEIEHLREGRFLKALRYLPLAVYFCFIPLIPLISEKFGLLPMLFSLFVLAALLSRLGAWISIPLEKKADSGMEAANVEHLKLPYASALTKIYQANLTPAVLPGKHHSHPDLYDRVESLGITPNFPRPLPPKMLLARSSMAFVIVFATMSAIPLLVVQDLQEDSENCFLQNN